MHPVFKNLVASANFVGASRRQVRSRSNQEPHPLTWMLAPSAGSFSRMAPTLGSLAHVQQYQIKNQSPNAYSVMPLGVCT